MLDRLLRPELSSHETNQGTEKDIPAAIRLHAKDERVQEGPGRLGADTAHGNPGKNPAPVRL